MSTIAPERSIEQRMRALEIGNDVRCWRAEQKRRLKCREVSFVAVFRSGDDRLGTMKVRDLMLAVPGVGATKVDKILRVGNVPATKTVRALTGRQADWIESCLRNR